jgi:arsenite-transporting ATPase
VGKTSISSALAVELASSVSYDDDAADWNVLIISTDPAHSLGDALDVNLRTQQQQSSNSNNQQPRPIVLSDPLTNRRLSALEVDPRAALSEFQDNLQRLFDMSSLSNNKFLEELGLTQELNTLLRNPPPGLDEYVALANVLDPDYNTNSMNGVGKQAYDVIIVDTAPTGHTLRMLQLPQFLDGFLRTLLSLRAKLKGLANTIQMFMGGNSEEVRASSTKMTVDDALTALENFQRRASQLRLRLQDSSCTKFVVVTIPTILSVRESQRLMVELKEQAICVSDLVVNQCIGGGGGGGGGGGDGVSDAMKRYYNRRVSGQQRWISELEEACMDVSMSEEYQSNSGQSEGEDKSSNRRTGISVTQVPFYDMELVGVPALGFIGSQTFLSGSSTTEGQIHNFERLIKFDQRDDDRRRNADSARIYNPKVVICGGKGGVGKTTTSASLAIAMASAGHNVAVVSTDPAHSLGDALDMDLRGGSLVDVPLFGVVPPPPTMTVEEEGTLKAMEIDPSSALKEFRDSIDKLLGRNTVSGSTSQSDLSSALRSLGEMIDTLPAGTDEVVALAKVIQLIRGGNFDRVVLDTAPTGHTLRMLTTPSFLADLIEKVLLVTRKLNSNAAIKMLLSSAIARNKNELNLDDDVAESAKNALLKFQVSMYDLEDMFADPTSTEFLIVTIGTELAVRESVRLLNELTFGDPDMPIRVRNVVVNQVLDTIDNDDEKECNEKLQGFVTRLTRSQTSSIQEITHAVDRLDNPPRVTKVELLDVEPRGVYGLKALSEQLLLPSSSTSNQVGVTNNL